MCTSCVEITRGTSLDVHELDAASNNGVEAMRDLIAHAALGTPGRWKVYIVDEVHMLSNSAANALLKTLEEPPGHVIFVLATTDPQKVPPTIRSRTQHFEFRLLGTDALAALVHDVNEAAGLQLDEESLSVAVRRGRGSARDTLSALDQVAASGSADDARPELAEVADALADEDAGRALVAVAALHEAGWGPQQLAAELVDDLRQAFLAALAPELATAGGAEAERRTAQADRLGLPRLVRSIEVLGRAQVEMRDAPDPRVVLEVALVRLARADLDDSTAALVERVGRLERGALAPHAAPAPPATPPPAPGGDPRTMPSIGALKRQRAAAASPPAITPPAPAPPTAAVEPPPAGEPPPVAGPAATASPPPATAGGLPDRDALVQAWGDQILRSLPARAKVLFAAGRFVVSDDGTVAFALPNAAHRERCGEVRPVVEEALSAHFGVAVPLRLVVESEAGAPGAATAPGDLDEGDDFDPTADAEPGPVAEARLLEAFPGAEEVPG